MIIHAQGWCRKIVFALRDTKPFFKSGDPRRDDLEKIVHVFLWEYGLVFKIGQLFSWVEQQVQLRRVNLSKVKHQSTYCHRFWTLSANKWQKMKIVNAVFVDMPFPNRSRQVEPLQQSALNREQCLFDSVSARLFVLKVALYCSRNRAAAPSLRLPSNAKSPHTNPATTGQTSAIARERSTSTSFPSKYQDAHLLGGRYHRLANRPPSGSCTDWIFIKFNTNWKVSTGSWREESNNTITKVNKAVSSWLLYAWCKCTRNCWDSICVLSWFHWAQKLRRIPKNGTFQKINRFTVLVYSVRAKNTNSMIQLVRFLKRN